MGFYIGVNGCSMKTAQNLEVLKAIRLDRLLLETGKASSAFILRWIFMACGRCTMVFHDQYTCLERASGYPVSLAALSLLPCNGSTRVVRPWKSSQGSKRTIISWRGCMGTAQVERHRTIRDGNGNGVQEYYTALLSR